MDVAESLEDQEPSTLNTRASPLCDDERARADTYSILAALFSAPPSQDLIDYLRSVDTNDHLEPGDMAKAWFNLKHAAGSQLLTELDDEYHDLFIGLGRGQVVPYGSWHITGFLMEKPLSDLRDDLSALGIQASGKNNDPEDHISALCESMSLLIRSDDIQGYQQRRFYLRHLNPWVNQFFQSLQAATAGCFYKSVGLLGQCFFELENLYLNINEHESPTITAHEGRGQNDEENTQQLRC